MALPDKVNFAGDIKINEVALINSRGFLQDVTQQIIGIEIYEDIFSMFTSGKLILKDAQEVTNLLPLIGEEIVRISLQTPSLKEEDGYKGEFYIYKMGDRMKISERETAYVLHFISKEAIVDLNKKISKAYSGKVSDIVKQVVTEDIGLETKKNLNVEDTSNITKYISNFWSPTRNLQYLCENAVNIEGSPSYIFFENKYGLNFLSLESMYSNAPLHQKFIWDNYSADINKTGSSEKNITRDYQRVLELNTPETFNYMDRLKSGMYGAELITYDLLTKQYTHIAYKPNFEEHKHLNQYPMWSDNLVSRPRSTIIQDHRYYNNFDGFDDVTNSKTIQKRTSLLAQAEAFKLEINVFGRTDYSAGQKVYLEVPRSSQISKDDPNWEDKVHSGYYVISAICHSITRESHECTMELIKDSIMVNLNNG